MSEVSKANITKWNGRNFAGSKLPELPKKLWISIRKSVTLTHRIQQRWWLRRSICPCSCWQNRTAAWLGSAVWQSKLLKNKMKIMRWDLSRTAYHKSQWGSFFGFDLIVFSRSYAVHSLSGAENRTRDGWMGSANASSVQCCPSKEWGSLRYGGPLVTTGFNLIVLEMKKNAECSDAFDP